jgi:hypothetical protein
MKKVLVLVVALGALGLFSGPALLGQTNADARTEGRSICVPYDPATLGIEQMSDGHWRLQRGDGTIFRGFVDREDAEAGLAVAKQNNQLCYIGKSNTQPDRERYIMEYWVKR